MDQNLHTFSPCLYAVYCPFQKSHTLLYISLYSTISLVHWNFSFFSLLLSVSLIYVFFLFAWRFLKVLASHENSHVFSRHVVCCFLLLTRMCTCGKTTTARQFIWSGTFIWEEEEIAHLDDISATRHIAFSKRFIN